MKKLFAALPFLLIFSFPSLFAQSEVETLVGQGVALHDEGKYKEAIEVYKKALRLAPKSTLVNYELALTYFTKGDYEKAIKYSNAVIKQKDDNMVAAYITKGSALDILGRTKESIKLFKKAIKKSEPHHLLYYNLGINYYKMGQLTEAEENMLLALDVNQGHPSSHLVLANIHKAKGNPVKTLLASYFFLLLEPYTERSASALEMIEEAFENSASTDPNDPKSIKITINPNLNDSFTRAKLMISMFQANKLGGAHKDKSEDELFFEQSQLLFTSLDSQNEKRKETIWQELYVSFFHDLSESEHLETYCKYVRYTVNEENVSWLEENQEKMVAFIAWIEKR